MDLIHSFLFAAAISFVGSLQIRPVNSEVLRFALRGRKKDALWAGIGGALPEIPYVLLSAFLIQSLESYPGSTHLFLVVNIGLNGIR